eukprot:Lankesteria_metandrocarpae@DN6640_c0_g1_i1.p1
MACGGCNGHQFRDRCSIVSMDSVDSSDAVRFGSSSTFCIPQSNNSGNNRNIGCSRTIDASSFNYFGSLVGIDNRDVVGYRSVVQTTHGTTNSCSSPDAHIKMNAASSTTTTAAGSST